LYINAFVTSALMHATRQKRRVLASCLHRIRCSGLLSCVAAKKCTHTGMASHGPHSIGNSESTFAVPQAGRQALKLVWHTYSGPILHSSMNVPESCSPKKLYHSSRLPAHFTRSRKYPRFTRTNLIMSICAQRPATCTQQHACRGIESFQCFKQ
jgi:hypothetical protein